MIHYIHPLIMLDNPPRLLYKRVNVARLETACCHVIQAPTFAGIDNAVMAYGRSVVSPTKLLHFFRRLHGRPAVDSNGLTVS